MCSIDWCALNWEAAATGITGLAVVVGATIVGLKQNRILASSHRLETIRAKAELFDKRYRVFVEFGVFLDLAAKGLPNQGPDLHILPQIVEGTRQNVERSQFLFGPEVFKVLSGLFEDGQAQLLVPEPSSALLSARTNLFEIFRPYLVLDDALLRTA